MGSACVAWVGVLISVFSIITQRQTTGKSYAGPGGAASTQGRIPSTRNRDNENEGVILYTRNRGIPPDTDNSNNRIQAANYDGPSDTTPQPLTLDEESVLPPQPPSYDSLYAMSSLPHYDTLYSPPHQRTVRDEVNESVTTNSLDSNK